MSLLDNPDIPRDVDDLARINALEHLVSSLYFIVASQVAAQEGVPVGQTARAFREGIKGSMFGGGWDPNILAYVRAHAGRVLDQTVAHADTADSLKNPNE
ncbi:MAG: hypothetical protein Q8S03_10275 [Brevundimonas sp.]|uniref:hypothetical protein n=1 Tax=Brevundimonas sp. TaxID=1871086 RepID=UPI002735C6DE|nr:hypothetical protein [Brevundimonas sp.]MDP3405065.1 hypothetical protein [Brevundimonas sp.]